MTAKRHFPPPWSVVDHSESFEVRDANGHALVYVYFEEEVGRLRAMGRLTKDEARRVAVNVARLPELLAKPSTPLGRLVDAPERAGVTLRTSESWRVLSDIYSSQQGTDLPS